MFILYIKSKTERERERERERDQLYVRKYYHWYNHSPANIPQGKSQNKMPHLSGDTGLSLLLSDKQWNFPGTEEVP